MEFVSSSWSLLLEKMKTSHKYPPNVFIMSLLQYRLFWYNCQLFINCQDSNAWIKLQSCIVRDHAFNIRVFYFASLKNWCISIQTRLLQWNYRAGNPSTKTTAVKRERVITKWSTFAPSYLPQAHSSQHAKNGLQMLSRNWEWLKLYF